MMTRLQYTTNLVILLLAQIFVCSAFTSLSSSFLFHQHHKAVNQIRNQNNNNGKLFLLSNDRSESVSSSIDHKVRNGNNNIVASFLFAVTFSTIMIPSFSSPSWAAATDSTDIAIIPSSILPCKKLETGTNNPVTNCISTSSIKEINLYSTPWTWKNDNDNDIISTNLKIAIEAIDGNFKIVQDQSDKNNIDYIRAIGTRLVFGSTIKDEIEFRINKNEKIITYKYQQLVDDNNTNNNSVGDFGKIRQRIQDIKVRTKGLLYPIGTNEFGITADTAVRPQGLTEQLKTFWGFQSGSGFEDILLE